MELTHTETLIGIWLSKNGIELGKMLEAKVIFKERVLGRVLEEIRTLESLYAIKGVY